MVIGMDHTEARDYARKTIISDVFLKAREEYISDGRGEEQTEGWLFDFRRCIMQGKFMDALSVVFTDAFKSLPRYQVCGLEVAAIPLVTGITQYRYTHGDSDANGFFIRKSRKKSGLLRMIEGTIQENTPIILVDDISNEGGTFMRQIIVLEDLGYKVHAVWSILRYRDISFYATLHERGIEVHSLFELNDFSREIDVGNLIKKISTPPPQQFHKALWKFSANNPNLFWVVPKSGVTLDATKAYFGADNGFFYAISQSDGSVAWSFKVGYATQGKSIFSTPAIHNDIVYFGSYDGNVYALNANTGKRLWTFFDADWVGSSPALAPELGIMFIGLEFGLFKKRGGIAAISMETGKKIWWDNTMQNLTHATPLYIEKTKQVSIGSNDGILRLYDAQSGTCVWKVKTGDPSPEELRTGFSRFDIKEAPAYASGPDLIIVANMEKDVYAINRTDGSVRWHSEVMEFGSWGTPCVHGDMVSISSLDKYVYTFNVLSGALIWKTRLRARVLASPILTEDGLIIGCNAGRISILNPNTGALLGYTTVSERITNRAQYNHHTKVLFVTTYANELYALKRIQE